MSSSRTVPFYELTLTDGFWKDRQILNAKVSIPSVYHRFDETDRFASISKFLQAPFVHSDRFYDSDTAKWIEAAAYVLQQHRKEYPDLEKMCDGIIDKFARLQASSGYLNSYFQRRPIKIKFFFRPDHELYCAGHIFEAAVAYKRATGKDKLMKVAEKYADHIRTRFMIKQNTHFTTPGHEEIELALYRMYDATGKEKYREMAEFFLENRGKVKERTYRQFTNAYDQHDKPIRELDSAEGHAVRAMYLYCAMADMAKDKNDKVLAATCRRLFEDARKKMYVTGGIGSDFKGECFTIPYDLPNQTAYAESCAAISFLLFCRRMLLIENDVRYADTIEKIMYNNLLSAVSLDGKGFFYENPLEIRQAEMTKSGTVKARPRFPVWQRQEVFGCSCCPPNVNRIIASIGDVVFTEDEDTLYLHQFVSCKYASVTVVTEYPVEGKMLVNIDKADKKKLAVRIPSWCAGYSLMINGELVNQDKENGYLYFDINDGMKVQVDLDMTPFYARCNPLCLSNVGKVALQRGPVVYCLEGVDNGDLDGLAVNEKSAFTQTESPLSPLPFLDVMGWELSAKDIYYKGECQKKEKKLRFTPYFTFANRGLSDMKVWVPTAK